jgi:hypothetical protein
MPEPRTVRRGARAVVAALVGMGVLAACTGGHSAAKAAPPSVGKADVIASLGDATPAAQALAAQPGAGGGPFGMASGTDGSLYLSLSSAVVRIAKKGQASTLATSSGSLAPRGVVTLPDDSFVTVENGQLVRIIPGQPNGVVAGVKGKVRPLTAPVPSGGAATSVHLTASAAPIGSLGDGSVVLADGDALWRLLAGKLTLLYHHPAIKTANGGYAPSVPIDGAAVTPTGTVYLPPTEGSADTLKNVEVITPAGSAAPLSLPAAIPGVAGDPAGLTPVWLGSDGKSGVYVHAVRGTSGGAAHGDYVFHVSDGKAELVAASTATGSADGCGATKLVDAAKFPCPMPRALVAQPGLLVLAGGEPYVVGVRLPKS